MAKLFVVLDRDDEYTTWHIYKNREKSQKKYEKLSATAGYRDDGDVDWWGVDGPHGGFLIGFDDQEDKVFAEPVFDVRNFKLDSYYYPSTTAYLIGIKTKEGEIEGVYGGMADRNKLESSVPYISYWENSKLMESTKNTLKHVNLFENFVNSIKK